MDFIFAIYVKILWSEIYWDNEEIKCSKFVSTWLREFQIKAYEESVFKLWNVSFKQFPATDMEIVYIEILQINLFVNFLSDWIF